MRQTLWQLQAWLRGPDAYTSDRLILAAADAIRVNPQADLWLDVAEFECTFEQIKGRRGAELDPPAARLLRAGIALADFTARPARVRRIDEPAALWPRDPPIRFRAAIPTAWLEIRISEGKNRQVRRMTAAIGYPVLRLIRAAIGAATLDGLAPGAWRKIDGSYKDLLGSLDE